MKLIDNLVIELKKESELNNLSLKDDYVRSRVRSIFGGDEDIFIEVVGKLEDEGVYIDSNIDEIIYDYIHFSDDPVRDYLVTIGQYPLFTPEEELECTKKVFCGDEKAKEMLIMRNLRLVVSIARRYTGKGVPFLDLIQEGNIGLMKAIDRFDPYKGFRFTTYTSWWIRQCVSRAVSDMGREIRIPVHMYEHVYRVNRFRKSFSDTYGREPSEEEISEGMQLDLERVKSLCNLPGIVAYLDAPVGEEGDACLGDYFEDENTSCENDVMKELLINDVKEALEILPEKEKTAIKLRYGLDGTGVFKTLEECGQVMNVTRERVRQLESKALRRLSRSRRTSHLREYVG